VAERTVDSVVAKALTEGLIDEDTAAYYRNTQDDPEVVVGSIAVTKCYDAEEEVLRRLA
jgi:hypothetical protein